MVSGLRYSQFSVPTLRAFVANLASAGITQQQRKALLFAFTRSSHATVNGVHVTFQKSFRTAVYALSSTSFFLTVAQ